jgi:hypothetical protein
LDVSTIPNANSEGSGSLNLSGSFAKGKAVLCEGARARHGLRCANDPTVCDCDGCSVVANDVWFERRKVIRDDALEARVKAVGVADKMGKMPIVETPSIRTRMDIAKLSQAFQQLDVMEPEAPAEEEEEHAEEELFDRD